MADRVCEHGQPTLGLIAIPYARPTARNTVFYTNTHTHHSTQTPHLLPAMLVPTLSLTDFTTASPDDRAAFIRALGKAFTETGFVRITDHGIPERLINDFYRRATNFFALPDRVKRGYVIAGAAGQRGYTPFKSEHAKHSKVADLKEFFQIGQRGIPPANPHVFEEPLFMDNGVQLYQAFERVGASLLRAIANYLHLDEEYFTPHITGGNSILRAIHYPPITEAPNSALRAEQHEDINLITLLVGASAGGLELLTIKNKWVEVNAAPGEIVVNVGDMLQRLTNNLLRSTTHRVVNPPVDAGAASRRLSVVFFHTPNYDATIACIPSCTDADHPPKYAPILSGEHIGSKLKAVESATKGPPRPGL